MYDLESDPRESPVLYLSQSQREDNSGEPENYEVIFTRVCNYFNARNLRSLKLFILPEISSLLLPILLKPIQGLPSL